jgi:glycosyltransferase involved in cell wall biosynthesis
MPILWDEPFGMVMIEAMAAGTPVIAYNRGSVSEVVRDGVTGFIVNPDGVRSSSKSNWIIKKQGVAGLVEAVDRVGEIKREACRRRVEDHFTTEHMVAGYEKVYKSILTR